MKYLIFVLTFFILGCSSSSEEVTALQQDDSTLKTAPTAKNELDLLVIRVSFSNITLTSGPRTWSNKIYGNDEGDLNHYYQEISNSGFSFQRAEENASNSFGEVDGVVTVTLNQPHPDPSSKALHAIHPTLKAALQAADSVVDFAQFDKNGDGNVASNEAIMLFIFAGNEDAFTGENSDPGVWAHVDCTDSTNAPTLDGVTLLGCANQANYAVFGERQGFGMNHDATIGIIAHELGHAAFKLPDLYNTDNSAAGIGNFGLMGAGSWAQKSATEFAGNTPTHMCAWSKSDIGFILPTTITTTKEITINAAKSTQPEVYKVPINSSEYFLIENRQDSGYDRGLRTLEGNFIGGLAIWHIDEAYISSHYQTNSVNDLNPNNGVDLEEAANASLDASARNPGDAKALFYFGNVDSFTQTQSNSGANSGISITNISSSSATMSATINQ